MDLRKRDTGERVAFCRGIASALVRTAAPMQPSPSIYAPDELEERRSRQHGCPSTRALAQDSAPLQQNRLRCSAIAARVGIVRQCLAACGSAARGPSRRRVWGTSGERGEACGASKKPAGTCLRAFVEAGDEIRTHDIHVGKTLLKLSIAMILQHLREDSFSQCRNRGQAGTWL